jgi:hypothetical protein
VAPARLEVLASSATLARVGRARELARHRHVSDHADLGLQRLGTRFSSAETEHAYQAWQLERHAPFNRAALAAGAIAVALGGAVGIPLQLADRAGVWSAWTFGVLVPVLALGAYVSHDARRRRWTPLAVALGNGLAGLTAVTANASEPGSSLVAAVILTYFVFAIHRVRLWVAVATAMSYELLALALYVREWWSGAQPATWLALHGFWLVICFATAMTANVVAGVLSRRSYVQERIIERQRETIAKERERSEALLKQELSHQVAARSRELGQMLARIDATMIAHRLASGDVFGERYRVARELGAGGMGAVYEVERVTDGERLALKIITGEISGAQAARFAREAEIGARIRHQNLVSIVDVGVERGVPFLAMELALHGSLEDERARFGDTSWALPVLAQVAAGLSALHDEGVVHRDLKPANVLFTVAGGAPVAKISDFGISRFGRLDGEPGAMPKPMIPDAIDPSAPTEEPAKHGRVLTATGVLLGTPYYMAPEAARGGRSLGPPADVFAFGIVACEVLTGQAPFDKPPIFFAMVGAGTPAPRAETLALLPKSLRATVLASLAESPSERPTMPAIIAALDEAKRALQMRAHAS